MDSTVSRHRRNITSTSALGASPRVEAGCDDGIVVSPFILKKDYRCLVVIYNVVMVFNLDVVMV